MNSSVDPIFNINPVPGILIKKCFLKRLYDDALADRKEPFATILRISIASFFNKKFMSDEEYNEGLRGIKDLERDGYIRLLANKIYRLTSKGTSVARMPIKDMRLPSINILDLITRPKLAVKIHNGYLSGEYENALVTALKLLEVTIRQKARMPNFLYGKKLIRAAFNPKTGVLKNPAAATENEKMDFCCLVLGAFGFLRNPSGHRFVTYDDPNEFIRIMSFVQFLLNQVDQCIYNESKK